MLRVQRMKYNVGLVLYNLYNKDVTRYVTQVLEADPSSIQSDRRRIKWPAASMTALRKPTGSYKL